MKVKDITILRDFINNKNVEIYKDEKDNIIIKGNVIVFHNEDYNYSDFPVKVHKVIGNIHWYGGITSLYQKGTLKSLRNFPDIVDGNVLIFKNPDLKSLEGCPEYISGTLQCDFCNIKSVEGIAKYIGRNCILNNNPIEDISYLSNIKVGGVISIVNTPAAYNEAQVNSLKDTSVVRVNESTDINYFDH